MMNEKINVLKEKVIENKGILPYINLDENNNYLGWVSDFHFGFIDGSQMKLDLKNEKDLFLLFVLAVAWSRTGRWENAACFAAYLKYHHYDIVSKWTEDIFVEELKKSRYSVAAKLSDYCVGMESRIKICFRKDVYASVQVLANHWNEILFVLDESYKTDDYRKFIKFMRSLNGLGVNNRKMNIKILLILRELRCQHVYDNIPGEYCCVPDERVKAACKELGLKLPVTVSENGLIKASEILYRNFGNLYDIPPFAYEDLMK